MAPRSRLPRNKLLVPNLYCQDGYYTYRHPVTKQVYGLGRDRGKALTQAIEANHHFDGQAVTLMDRITGRADRTVNDWCDEYGQHPRMKWLREGIGHHVLETLTPLDINTWLDKWSDKHRMRQAMLSTAKVVLGAAIGKGWITSNPASDLTTPAPKTMRVRLTLDAYMAIYHQAEPPLQRAMELALLTCARRENVIGLQRSDISDGYLHVEHIKAGLKVRYPLSLHLSAVGWTLGDVIGRCRSSVVSRYFIHHIKHAGRAKPGDKFRDKTIEQMFREAREAAGIVVAHPPTFHEIRSLAIRLWDAAGYDAKKMAGHKTDQSSALYKDSRGADWVSISVNIQ
jgi:enterobacteria phage integrase